MLEGTIEFAVTDGPPGEGLILNDLSAADNRTPGYTGWYRVTSVDGLWDQETRFESRNLPGKSGARSGDAWYSGKTLVISGFVIAKDLATLRQMQLTLQHGFDDMLPHKLFFTLMGLGDFYITCRKNQKIDMPETQDTTIYRRPFTVQLFADNPNIYRQSDDSIFVLF